MQISETHVETEGNQSVKLCLAIRRARAQSKYAALKTLKIRSQNRNNPIVTPILIMLRPQRIALAIFEL